MILRGALLLPALLLAAATAVSTAQPPPVTGLTAPAELAAVYDAILDARFDEVPSMLEEACGPAPEVACQVLDAVALWWRIQVDSADRSRDGMFHARVDAAIEAAEAWTEREPGRAEAWFYLGGAYGARAQWRALRGDHLRAAFDGRRIKEALERALALDPGMHDAWFGIGLYHYYAGVAPAVLRLARWLLTLPGGDREQGLEEMLRAREHGRLLRGEADYQLHRIYLWYEDDPRRAMELLRALRDRHPTNPHFARRIAAIEHEYLRDDHAIDRE